MTDESTAGLSLKQAFAEAEAELSLSGESTDTDMLVDSETASTLGEQPAVEKPQKSGLFDALDEDNGLEDQPETQESYEVTVQGERFLVSLDELRNGYMRQADYTQKTQELKTLEREAQRGLALIRMLEEKPAATLQKLYQRINAGQPLDFVQETTGPAVAQTQAPNDIDALVEAKLAERLANDPQLVALRQERALAQVESIFTAIEKDYGVELSDSDKQKVLLEAQAKGTTDLNFVFGGLYAAKLKADRQRELEKRNARQVATVQNQAQGRMDSHPAPTAPKKYDSFKSALLEELALEQDTGIQTVSAL